jgi:hypothetical protein
MDRPYVGIDFHRRRSVIVRLDGDGQRLGLHRIVNDPAELAAVMTQCGDAPEVVIEATYGWYWAVDLLQDLGATVHLAAPILRLAYLPLDASSSSQVAMSSRSSWSRRMAAVPSPSMPSNAAPF